MKITFILLIAFVSMNYSCESQNISPKSELIEAVILDGGPIPTENCGWIIKVNDSYYSPSNLSPVEAPVNRLILKGLPWACSASACLAIAKLISMSS